jgi:hypothetical protein
MNNLIVDKEHFDKFINILPDLQKDENYFLSLAARNKYLSTEEREKYQLGRTEMFGRLLARSKEDFTLKMKDLAVKLESRKTNNGSSIPNKAVVVYANINPTSMIKAYEMFMNEMNKEIYSAFYAEQKNKGANYESIKFADRVFMNCCQKARSRRVYIDIDMDTKDKNIFEEFISFIDLAMGIDYHIIETHGGYHFLIKCDTISEKFNFYNCVYDANLKAEQLPEPKEVIINKNQMVPIAGTKQSDFLVKVIK